MSKFDLKIDDVIKDIKKLYKEVEVEVVKRKSKYNETVASMMSDTSDSYYGSGSSSSSDTSVYLVGSGGVVIRKLKKGRCDCNNPKNDRDGETVGSVLKKMSPREKKKIEQIVEITCSTSTSGTCDLAGDVVDTSTSTEVMIDMIEII